MKKHLIVTGCVLLLAASGCKRSAPAPTEATQASPAAAPIAPARAAALTAPVASEWKPTPQGIPYQLSLAKGIFGFCDDAGSHQLDLATGQTSTGTATCDRKNEVVQSSCDDRVKIYGDTGGGNDDLDFGDNSYTLKGHSRECDLDGKTLIVSTANAVEVIDAANNKVAIVDPAGGDKAVIGSGWVAWTSLDAKDPLRLETVAKALEHAQAPK